MTSAYYHCLALDPGHKTGVCHLRPSEAPFLRASTMTEEQTYGWLADIWRLHLDDDYDVVLVEKPPASGDAVTLGLFTEIARKVRRHSNKLVTPMPAEWKPFVKANPVPDDWKPYLRDEHQRDAARMIWWWLQTHKEE